MTVNVTKPTINLREELSKIQKVDPNLPTWPVGVTATEVSHLNGVTSSIQTQLDTKAPTASPALTGTPTAPTAALGTNTTQVATTAFVQAAAGGLVLLETQTASSSPTLEFTSFDDAVYDSYIFKMNGLQLSSGLNTLYLRTSSDGGATYDAGGTDYEYASVVVQQGEALATSGSGGTSAIVMASNISDTTGRKLNGSVELFAAGAGHRTTVDFSVSYRKDAGGTFTIQKGGGERSVAGLTDAVQFDPLLGSFTSGTIRMYGVKK